MTTFKTCSPKSGCGESKPLSEFYTKRHPSGRPGYMSVCRTCNATLVAEWRAANPEQALQINSEWHARNRDDVNAARRVKYAARKTATEGVTA